MYIFTKKSSILFILSLSVFFAQAQPTVNDDYVNVVKGRAYKIVTPLGISDSAKFYKVRDEIAQEYIAIKKIDDEKDQAIKAAKAKSLDKTATDQEIAAANTLSEEKRTTLNKAFVLALSKHLSEKQIEQVKDGLTYNVLPLTYKAHLDMIPSLKEDEKKFIYDALFEAREHAMAAGSSDAKHAWFGKYKGRINNYLAKKGYDLKKEREQWYERIKTQKKD